MFSNQNSSAAVYVGGPSRHAIAEFVDFYSRHKKAMRAIEDAIAVNSGAKAAYEPTISGFAGALARHIGSGRDEEKDGAQLRASMLIVQLERFCFVRMARGGWNLDRERTISSITDIWWREIRARFYRAPIRKTFINLRSPASSGVPSTT